MIPLLSLLLTWTHHAPAKAVTYPLTSTKGLQLIGSASAAAVTYRGKKALLLTEDLDPSYGDVAVVQGISFSEGTIEFDVTGDLTPNAPRGARGFVGIAFHGDKEMRSYENFYLRMTNGHSPDPVLRKHAAQYCAVPTYMWDLLRKKRPSRYEAPADVAPGVWTHVKLQVRGGAARFWVGSSVKPTIVVDNLLLGNRRGKVGLWVDGYTRGYFANLSVRS